MVVNPHQQIPETFVHIQLLNHGYHVANIAQVFQSSISSRSSLVYLSRIDYLYLLKFVSNSLKSLFYDDLSCFFTVLTDFQNQFIKSLPSCLLTARSLKSKETVIPKNL